MCSSKGFIRRMLPFFATFAVGLFIASFFVNISAPRFGRGRWMRQEYQRMQAENERLRSENLRLKNALESHDWTPLEIPTVNSDNWKGRGPEFPVEGPPPPPKPVAPHGTR